MVGVGSVGTQAWVLLSRATGPTGCSCRQGGPGVGARAVMPVPAPRTTRASAHGRRLLTQAVSDPFPGWGAAQQAGLQVQRDYYVRQLRDWKALPRSSRCRPPASELYGKLCATTRTRPRPFGSRVSIAAYPWSRSDRFEKATAAFAEASMRDLNDRDHATAAAIAGFAGLPAVEG